MEDKTVTVKVKNIAQSARKLRLVADTIRNQKADTALDRLTLLNKKGADIVEKALLSGIANGRELHGVDKDGLIVSKISVDESKTLKRVRFASRGRIAKINKRRSHLNLELKVK